MKLPSRRLSIKTVDFGRLSDVRRRNAFSFFAPGYGVTPRYAEHNNDFSGTLVRLSLDPDEPQAYLRAFHRLMVYPDPWIHAGPAIRELLSINKARTEWD